MAMFKMFGVGQAQFLSIVEKSLMFHRAASKAKSIISALNLPAKPKAPPNPYSIFIIEQSKEILGKFPNLTFGEKSKYIAKKWAEMSPEEKEKFVEKFRKRKNEYKIKMENYNNSLTDVQKKELQILKKEMNSASSNNIVMHLKKKLKEEITDKPKRPLNAFLKFCIEKNGGKKNIFPIKDSSAEWKNLPSNVKEKYKAEYEKDCEQFEKDLLEWEIRRIKSGNNAGVRSKTLKAFSK